MATPSTQSVFLVSGGARGITAQCVIEMAKAFQCKFILLGRTAVEQEPAWAQGAADEPDLKRRALTDMQARGEKPTPIAIGKAVSRVQAAREINQTLAAVTAAGSQVVYLSADITNADALRTALASASEWGPVTGIVHGAGNLADKLIENKTEADFESVYAAKVTGLENLLALVPAASLEVLVLFSSVAGFYGNIGQSDYAIANEVLNKIAHQYNYQHPNCHVVSINWGPWDGGMVTPQLRAYFDSLDIRVIPVEVGARMLIDELRLPNGAPAQIVVGSAIRPQPAPPSPDLQTYRLRRRLRLEDSPFLASHVVNAQAVLPMVSAMSWMASACEGIHRGYRCFSFSDYRVLKGIIFDNALADEYLLELTEVSKQADEIVIDAKVRSQSIDGKPRFHYSARLVLLSKIPDAPLFEPVFTPEASQEREGTVLYTDGTLFHGECFQGIDRVLSIDERGLMMRCALPLVSIEQQGQFPVQAFNYFMVDIGLQSIGVWARHFYHMGSLPLRAVRGEFYDNANFGDTFYVTMQVSSHTETHVSASIILHDENYRVYVRIDDLEVTMSSRLDEMFLKNRLPQPLL